MYEDERRALPSGLRDVASGRAADCAQAASDLREAGFIETMNNDNNNNNDNNDNSNDENNNDSNSKKT